MFYENGLRSSDETTHWQRAISFTTPNARCPDCNAPVYFYKSPYGGRVFFNDLGPPWLKHPCTDTSRIEQRSAHGSKNRLTRKESGWRPFYYIELYENPGESGGIVLVSQNELGITKLFARFDKKLVDHRTPFFIRKDLANAEAYEIATLNALETYPIEVRFKATTFIPPPASSKTNNSVPEKMAASDAQQILTVTAGGSAGDSIAELGQEGKATFNAHVHVHEIVRFVQALTAL